MTGSGGTVGAVVTQLLLFSGDGFSKQTSIFLMGLMIVVFSLSVTLIYFPRRGGMFCGPSAAAGDDFLADSDGGDLSQRLLGDGGDEEEAKKAPSDRLPAVD